MNGKTKQIVTAALFAALACVATMVIKIPSPMDGYLNLGDCVVLAAGWLLAPGYGFLAEGLGSGLADLFSGYAAYAPATFAIKGLMALIAFYGFKALSAKTGSLTARILSGAAAELWMVLGYYLFEGCLYGQRRAGRGGTYPRRAACEGAGKEPCYQTGVKEGKYDGI